jgi:hypothetical protein
MAITTAVSLANAALARIGQTARITSLTATSTAAQACNQFYDTARRGLLEEFRWRFATRRTVLVESVASKRQEWGYVYELPADFLSAQFINAGERDDQVPRDGRISFTLEFEPAAGEGEDDPQDREVLLTDVAPVADAAPELLYTFDQTAVGAWTEAFKSAVAWRLAAEICLPLSVKPDRARLAFDMAQSELNAAIAKHQRGRQADPPPESEFITSRG